MILFQSINSVFLLLKTVFLSILFELPFVDRLVDPIFYGFFLGLISKLADHLRTDEYLVFSLFLAINELHVNQLLDDVVKARIDPTLNVFVENTSNDMF